ncbi:hypothetical protein [Streptomyces sp. NBC_00624]|uniref:hypothetical protein n=1 Tax=Streptomyces sp. NBC_00624 TaxID=2975791 RepID=UPI002F917608
MPKTLPKTLTRPKGAPADWPAFPAVDALTGETPLPDDQWPALDLSWQLVTPYMLHFTTVTLYDALLVQPGAPGPVAMAYRHEFNRAYPYGWGCAVHVLVPGDDGRTRMAYDCQGFGLAKSAAEARDEALEHVTEKHPDAAVPYVGRVLKAHRSYA